MTGRSPSGRACGPSDLSQSSLSQPEALVPNALVKLSYEIGYCDAEDDLGFSIYGAKVRHIRDLMRFVHKALDWKPINTAPTDGSRFIVYSGESDTYDFAQFDPLNGEFCKDGCGWHYATLWAPTSAMDCTVGVGDGSGQLFVHGSYEAVKRVQSIILDRERLRAASRIEARSDVTGTGTAEGESLTTEGGDAHD